MKTRRKLFKNFICGITALTLILFANIGLLNLIDYDSIAFAVNNKSQNEITITNQNFDSSPDSEYPFDPTGFTSSSDTETAGVNAGVINVTEDEYSKYKTDEAFRDNYVLMIDSTLSIDDEENDETIDGDTTDDEIAHNTNFGFCTNDSISLEANKNYSISVDVYTSNNNGIGALYLLNSEDNSIYASITNISSLNHYTTYTFFVTTNDIENIDVKLAMYLRGAGVVLFDSISAFELNSKTLERNINNLNSSSLSNTYVYIDERDNLVEEFDMSTNPFTISNFESGKNSPDYTTAELVENTIDAEANDGNIDSAFRITNNKATYVEYETSDNFFEFDHNSVYKVSIFVKTKDLNGNASLQLIQTNLDTNDDDSDSEESEPVITISSNTGESENITNDYQEYSFYVRSSPIKSTTFKLVVSLGDADNLTSGKMYIASIITTKVDYSTFNNVSTGTYAQTIDLAEDYIWSDNDIYVDNGNFNDVQITDYSSPYPATPTDWTRVDTGNHNQFYGVINTLDTEFSKLDTSKYSNLYNPGDPYGVNGSNNVLMMYNSTADIQSYRSETKSLTARSYYKFTLQVQTQNAPAQIQLVSTIDEREVVLSSITVNTLDMNWHTVTMYLYTGYQAIDVSVKIVLDTTNSEYGYVYVDNITFNNPIQPTSTEFEQATNSTYQIKTDLENLISSVSDSAFSTPNYFEGSSNENVTYGVVDLTNRESFNSVIANSDNYASFSNLQSNNKNVLAIRAQDDVYYTLTSKLGFDLTGGNYYKISIYVYTQNLQILDETIDDDLAGASIKLSSFDETFTQIVSDGHWSIYTFYIQPNSDTTTYLELSLGSSSANVAGDVFFGGIEFIDYEDDSTEFDNASENSNTKILTQTTTEENTDDEESDDNDDGNDLDYNTILYYISSILFALAIIIAIVGVLVRKIKWKKPVKKSKTEYDRNRTVSKQLYQRKAISLRESKLRELHKELESMHIERAQYEDEYKSDLSKLREMKIKRADQSEINKLQKEMKKKQKLSANIGLSISRLESEIEFTKSDQYLNNLMKKLEREQQETMRNAEISSKENEEIENKDTKQSNAKNKNYTSSETQQKNTDKK